PWRDVLHDGPVPPDHDGDYFCLARAEFLASRGWSTAQDIRRGFEERDAQLAAMSSADEVVLWFEPDLYDQLQLIQVLARLARREAQNRPRLTIAPADVLLGPLSPTDFVPLYPERREISEHDLKLALRAWTAFTAAEPTALQIMVDSSASLAHARAYRDDA